MPAPRDPQKRVRYAVVGLGHIAQVAVLPAFAHARKNSTLEALVSGNPDKLRTLGRRYGVTKRFSYDDFGACLAAVDAVYIALPNSMHREFTVRAAEAGVHVLCEKPLAVTAADCEGMIDACRAAGVKLMVAYRLHFDRINLDVIDLVRRGKIGDPRFFNSSFAMTVKAGNIRTKRALGGGTLYDIGVYCINAARYIFRDEPTEVTAISVHSGAKHVAEVDESTAAILRFDGGKVASFVTSFNSADTGFFQIVGTKGDICVDPAYEYAEGLSYEITINGKTRRKRAAKSDQFAPELLHFSDCVLRNREPEPSGDEGLQDVRIVEALYKSADTGRSVALPPYEDAKRPTGRQRITRPAVRMPKLVEAESASKG